MFSHIVCCEKLIFYCNHKQICKECSQTHNIHLLYRKFLPMWYFELQLDYAVSKYNPKLPGFLSCFLLILKQQCIKVWLCKLMRCANKWPFCPWLVGWLF